MYGFTPFKTQNPNLSGLGDTLIMGPDGRAVLAPNDSPGSYTGASSYGTPYDVAMSYVKTSTAGLDFSNPPTWLLVAGGALLGLALFKKR